MRDDLDALEAEVDAFLQTREDGRFSITETGALTIAIHAVTRSQAAKALSAHPAILGLCADLIGPDVRLYWDQAVYKKTEKPRRVPWHQDNGYTYVEPQEYLTVWLALTDATEENGCPEVAPGAHRPRHAAAPLHRPARLGVPRGGHAVGAGAGARGRRGGVQLAHAAPHRPQPHRRGAQGLHPPVLPVRRGDPPRRADRRARPSSACPAPRPSASTRCSAAATGPV